MLVRLYLFVAGYPRVGGGGLHIAHMIWGALLMLGALLIAVSFVSTSSRWCTAVIGGLGFGLLVDETGKFLTSDNNYFFKPAAALIYVLFISIFLFSRTIARRRGFTSEEYIDNSLTPSKEQHAANWTNSSAAKSFAMARRPAIPRSWPGPSASPRSNRCPRGAEPSRAARFRRNLEARYAHIARRQGFSTFASRPTRTGSPLLRRRPASKSHHLC